MAIASIHSPSTPWLKTAHLRGFVHVPTFEPRYARGTLYLEVQGAPRVTARRQQLPGEHPMDLLRWILSRGIIVAWRVPRPMELGAPAAEHLDSLTTRWFHGDYNSPKDYQDVIKSLLCRPPARQWLLRGGLAWRLALHYGPPWLMGVALQGPSSIALTLGRGSYHQLPVLSIGDAMTAQENEMLVGRTPGGSVWPSIALWESSGMWIGEWTETAEFWFMRRVSELAEGRNVYQTEAQWARELRKALTPKERKLGEEDGSLRRAMELAHIYPEVAASSMIQVG
ncbi:hypothetical protein EWM64_g5660 [Hericium alpestre]|uniref:Uncharacterized protein n=1 Tax=Hericium alpestre TaxID=135208 RepID=A0A4Y9ZWR5_9AGAM|nr:hypothetical protein EWM64_g5660 [Hericium alpestre]